MESIINPKENYILGELSESDRNYILDSLKTYLLEYREFLQINGTLTFGLEIEFISTFEKTIREHISKYKGWNLTIEGAIPKGLEVTSPILVDYKDNWITLKKICTFLKKYSYINDYTGGHIHIGAHILDDNPQYWLNFIKLWAAYEHIIYRFLYGERLSHRKSLTEYALPMRNTFLYINALYKRGCPSVQELVDLCPYFKRFGLNFGNVPDYNTSVMEKGNTIEIRCPNASLNNIIWQNNVNLIAHLFIYSTSKEFNTELLNNKMAKYPAYLTGDDSMFLYDYSLVHLDDAIELGDLIFTNNLDKMYFLRQYIKNEKLSEKRYYLSKRFTKIK